MAGSPKKAAMLAELERRTRTEFPDEPEATHLDYVARWQAGGDTGLKLAKELGVSWELLKDNLDRKYGRETVNTQLSRAREAGAHRRVDMALDIADEISDEPSKEEIAKARVQIQANQWVAEKWNARELGAKQGAGTVINIGTLMLDALMQPPPPNPFVIPAVIAEDAQLVSATDAETCEVEQ
jgi:hypothetical protein